MATLLLREIAATEQGLSGASHIASRFERCEGVPVLLLRDDVLAHLGRRERDASVGMGFRPALTQALGRLDRHPLNPVDLRRITPVGTDEWGLDPGLAA